jgi:hypothetical protein
MIDPAALQRARARISRGIWITVGLTMIASAASGAYTYYVLQKSIWGIALGLATALAVDVALWVVMTGDRQLQLLGLDSGRHGRIMRLSTAGMSIVLNCTAAVLEGQPMLVVLHAFVPLLFVGLTEYSERVSAQFAAAELASAPPPVVVASERPDTTQAELASVRAELAKVQRQLEARPPSPTVTALPFRPRAVPSTSRRSPVRDRAFAWLDDHHDRNTTAAVLAKAINGSPDTCKKLLSAWRAEQQKGAAL